MTTQTKPPPEVLLGATRNMLAGAAADRDGCHDDLRRAWHQGRVSALMDVERMLESWLAEVGDDER